MSKLADAQEELRDMTHDRDECLRDLRQVVGAVRRAHEDHHRGVFRWCDRVLCREVRDVVELYEEAM